MRRLEDRLLAADESRWSRHPARFVRTTAYVPHALYVNFVARRAHVATLAPGLFEPLALSGDDDTQTLFTILLFSLENARPSRAPAAFGAFVPSVMHSNWRVYGRILGPAAEAPDRPGVLFVRSVSTSLLMAFFGRRLARCFPLHRAEQMSLAVHDGRVTATIQGGGGSAPGLAFEGTRRSATPGTEVTGRLGFQEYADYTRWIVDQHLSLAVWPRERIVQDMHLDFRLARTTPLDCATCDVTGIDEIIGPGARPFDCFLIEGLRVFLDSVSSDSVSRVT